ncbi:MAG TPA: hypothetical protein PKW42_11120, partial [bacterium]|nr:hypothetical protein [bacterium]
AGFLQSSIMASINYQERDLVFQELVECYLAVIKEIGERETKTYTLPLVSSLNLEQVRQRLAYLQQTAEMVRRYQEIVRIYLRHVELEKMRAGAPQTHCELQEKTEELRQELKRLVSAYEESFRPYQSALLARIDLLDFPRWLKGEIEVVWELFDRKSGVRRSATYLLEQTTISTRARMRETSQPILEVRFAPVATVVLTNSSRQYPFSGKVEVQYRDSTGSLRGQVSQEVSLASGEKKELLIESPKRFQGSEVVGTNVFRDNLSVEQLTQNLRKWQAELFLNGKSYGRVTIRF